MSISTKVPRVVDNSIWNMLRVRSRPSGSSRSGCEREFQKRLQELEVTDNG